MKRPPSRRARRPRRTAAVRRSPRRPAAQGARRTRRSPLARPVVAGSRPRPRAIARWNPDAADVERSVAQLVLTLVEFIRKLLERQAVRRMQRRTLSRQQVEDVGVALMRLERTVHKMARRFGLSPADLNLDLGPAGKLL